MWEQNGTDNTRKNNSTTSGNKPESSGEIREIKDISTKDKTKQTKQDIRKQPKKILQTTGRAWHKNIATTRRQRDRTFLNENMATKKAQQKSEWINNMTRKLEGLEDGPKGEIHIDLLKKTLKTISKWKTPCHHGIHGFWFKKFTSILGRLALEMKRCLQDAQVSDWMTKGKTTLTKKDPNNGTAPNNHRPITCLPVMWKILTAQKWEEIYYSLTSHGLFPEEQKGCRKGSKGTIELLYIDQHILGESKTKRKTYLWPGLLQKGIWHGSAKLDNKMSQNVPNNTLSPKLHLENHEDESWIHSRRKKLGSNKDPNRYFPRICTTILTIHNCHDAPKPHTQKLHSRIQT